MGSGKQFVSDVLNELPDDSSIEDILYALYVRHAIRRGETAAEEGRIVPHEDVMREMAEWLRR